MGVMPVTGPKPTLSEWVLAARANPFLADVTREDVVQAAHLRGPPIWDGRIYRIYAGNLYFGLCEVKGVSTWR